MPVTLPILQSWLFLRFLLSSELQPISVTSRDSKRPYQSTYHIPPKKYSVGSLKWRHKWPHRLCWDMHIPWSSYSGNTSIELLACHDNVINQQSSDRGFFRFIARQTATADPPKWLMYQFNSILQVFCVRLSQMIPIT